MEKLTLQQAEERLGDVAWITLDGPWGFDPLTGEVGREDQKFHMAAIVQNQGPAGPYPVLVLVEEPKVLSPQDGSPRVVGRVAIHVNENGLIKTREVNSPNGKILEVPLTSVSKDEALARGLQPQGIFYTNPQRLLGAVEIYLVQADFPDREGMTPEDFIRASTDGRSITAIAKAGLLSRHG